MEYFCETLLPSYSVTRGITVNMSSFNLTATATATYMENTTNTTIPTSTAAKVVIGFALESIVLMTIGGNILVLLAVILNRKLRTTTNYIVVSLAVADLFLGSLVLPFSAIYQMEQRWMFGTTFCDIWAAIDVLCCTASILSLCAISIDRYIGVTRPLQHRVRIYLNVYQVHVWAFGSKTIIS